MPFTKRSEEACLDDGPGVIMRLQIITLLIMLSYGISSVAAVDVAGFPFNSACAGDRNYACIGLPAADCCGFDGMRPSLSLQFTGIPAGSFAYSWTGTTVDPDCGRIQSVQTSTGQALCIPAGVFRITGGSWSDGGHFAVSGDGATVSIPKCKNVVKATPVRFNTTSNSWYSVDNESPTSSNHTDNSRT